MTRSSYALVILIGYLAWSPRAHARAAPVESDRLVVPGNSGVMTLPVHSSLMTVLHFPEPVERVMRSDEQHFVIGAKGMLVGIRPLPDAPVGMQASLNVITRTMRLGVRLQVVEKPADAELQVSFVPYVVDIEPTPPLKERLSFALAATVGETWGRERDVDIGTVTTGGVSARLGYQGSRFHAYEASITFAQTTAADVSAWPLTHDSGREVPGTAAEYNALILGAGLGLSVRLPTRITPVLRVAGGMQRRTRFGARARIVNNKFDVDEQVNFEFTGRAECGFELRISNTWLVGIGLSMSHAIPLNDDATITSLEGMIYVGLH